MKLPKPIVFLATALMLSSTDAYSHDGHTHAPTVNVPTEDINLSTPWKGKKVAFLGDSMTDPKNKSTKKHYWKYLETLMGIEPHVYARSGYKWDGIYKKAVEMNEAVGDSIDAIIIWAGTNDYNHSFPIGQFFTETTDSVNVNGTIESRKHRTFEMNDTTFTGNINRVMSYLKHNYPTKQIIIMTPIHRGYAKFNDKNVQPDENYANGQGLYVESYIDILRQAATLWAVPLIDLYSESGLFPMEQNHDRYFHHDATDRLHPNDNGHYRIARVIQAKLNSIPPTF
ncbi:SGNH/GDSL hydrolase family protein [uncultured Duncaniella sp.]|uniref:SGNH/GDSL hydrolase family protein n=1 Tax=uncultured Duncaniella sp. TaxID=2768039 RepID=UPI0025E8B4B8|nr:SGNH/GDSL hydrolase family protein [uncultured Duncaniella sp.]